MTDPFKIQLASLKYPASFVAYDIIYVSGKTTIDLPLMQRKKLLQDIVTENNSISISRFVEESGIALFTVAKNQNLEGIVAKKKDSKYYFDKRTKNWIKCKVMATNDCIICGYIKKANNMTSLVLGQYNGNQLIYKGHVTLGVSLSVLDAYGFKIRPTSPINSVPPGNENAIWLEPTLVCIVESMPTDKNSFRQPVFKGIRNDKLPEECRIEV